MSDPIGTAGPRRTSSGIAETQLRDNGSTMSEAVTETLSPDHKPLVFLIAAVARNGVIGRGGELVWRDPVDAKHFRETTMGFPVIMGRKTWDSLPERFRPLPGRRNIVITRNEAWRARGAESAASLDEALRHTQGSAKVFVMGGADIYALALPSAAGLVLTEISADIEGDVHFPSWDRNGFEPTGTVLGADARGTPFSIVTYLRRTAPREDA